MDTMNQDPYAPPVSEPDSKLRLWNPRTAAVLSVIFSPAFGAAIHALNWRRLGKPSLASVNWLWAAGVIAFLLILVLVPGLKIPQALNTPIALGLLLGWFFSVGKRQVEAVQSLQTTGTGYDKRSWIVPVMAALGAVAVMVGIIFWSMTAAMTPEALASELKPLVETAWRKNSGNGQATVHRIDLQKQGSTTFRGTATGSIGDHPVSVPIQATLNSDGSLEWKTGE